MELIIESTKKTMHVVGGEKKMRVKRRRKLRNKNE